MKKVLLGTSAIALAGAFVTQASAAEWEVRVGGYYEAQLGYASSDSPDGTDYDGVDVKTDSEIHFSPSITLDNGIRIGARIELEGATNSDQIDENYVYVTGSFGRLVLGENDAVSYDMAYSAPDVTFVGVNSGDDTLWLPFADAFGTTTTFVEIEADSSGIQYFTPRMAGFQLGVSYARDANKATDDAQKDENEDGKLFNIWAIGANYVNSFGDVSVAASAVYTRGTRNGMSAVESESGIVAEENGNAITTYYCSDDLGDQDVVLRPAICAMDATGNSHPAAYAFGLNVGFGGFTVGGSYSDFNSAAGGAEAYDVGVSYETGPWGFSLTWVHGDQDGTGSAEIDKFLLGVNYNLATGVRLGAWGIYEDTDYSGMSGDPDGFALGTGIRVSF